MQELFSYWEFNGFTAVLILFMLSLYLYQTRLRLGKKSIYYFLGIFLIILSVASPLSFLGENYLMSAHMACHVIILLISAPLLVIGISEEFKPKPIINISRILKNNPWIGWMSGVCVMWFWHIPVVFNKLLDATNNEGISTFQNIHLVSLVIAGILFCWPVIGPVKSLRIEPLKAVLYLSLACVFCSVLGLLITFAPVNIYSHYTHITDRLGFLNMIRNEMGLSRAIDQQVSGLIMWVPGCLIYLTGAMYILIKWLKTQSNPLSFALSKSKV